MYSLHEMGFAMTTYVVFLNGEQKFTFEDDDATHDPAAFDHALEKHLGYQLSLCGAGMPEYENGWVGTAWTSLCRGEIGVDPYGEELGIWTVEKLVP
jgi:hypothetical protein